MSLGRQTLSMFLDLITKTVVNILKGNVVSMTLPLHLMVKRFSY